MFNALTFFIGFCYFNFFLLEYIISIGGIIMYGYGYGYGGNEWIWILIVIFIVFFLFCNVGGNNYPNRPPRGC